MTQYEVLDTEEFLKWFEEQNLKTKSVISKRLQNIIDEGHFGDHKNVSEYDSGITKDRVFELRWDDGKRVYYSKVGNIIILLLLGGNKNGQDKNIKQAKKIFCRVVETAGGQAKKRGKS